MNYTLIKKFFSQHVIFVKLQAALKEGAGTTIALLEILAALLKYYVYRAVCERYELHSNKKNFSQHVIFVKLQATLKEGLGLQWHS